MLDYVVLAGFLVLTVGGGLAIGFLTAPGKWYAGLSKPCFNPPNWIFGPVWTVLYIFVTVAGWLVWRHDAKGILLYLWAIQLVLNFLWSPLFFSAHQIGRALAVVALLVVVSVIFIIFAWMPVRSAAVLFIPYAAWVAFAALLNASIWRLN